RFTNFVYSRTTVINYLKDILAFRPKHYLGHNPAGGAMVIALLLSLTGTVITGISLYGASEYSGPLAQFWAGSSHFTGKVLEGMHEFFANTTMLLVVAHLVGVALASFQHGENLVRSMVTGKKETIHED
ncbi:MAG: cytochrome b/b6 domain-containing protein, partial [Gammaproteobacteria bacterium]|nr:cytochrome b/b6 domain-containing protein [Gammaproteobacteria bacterium]